MNTKNTKTIKIFSVLQYTIDTYVYYIHIYNIFLTVHKHDKELHSLYTCSYTVCIQKSVLSKFMFTFFVFTMWTKKKLWLHSAYMNEEPSSNLIVY